MNNDYVAYFFTNKFPINDVVTSVHLAGPVRRYGARHSALS